MEQIMRNIKDCFINPKKRQKFLIYIAIGLAVITILHICLIKLNSNMPTKRKFLKQVKSENKYDRISAIYGLGKANNEKLIPLFVDILMTDPQTEVKNISAWAIGNTDKDKLVELLQTDKPDIKLIVMGALINMGKENIDYIFKQIDDKNLPVKTFVINSLGKYPDPKYNDKILSIAQNQSEDINIRLSCLDILKNTGNMSMNQKLSELSSGDPNEQIRNDARTVVDAINKKGGV